MLTIHKPKYEKYEITTIRTSNKSHLHWKDHFYKNLLFFKIIADFEAGNEIDKSNIGNKTISIYKQNPVLNVYWNELDDFRSTNWVLRISFRII